MSTDVVNLQLTVFGEGIDQGMLDEETTSLISQLSELDVYSIDYKRDGKAVIGAKGDPITIGAIILGIASSSIPPLVLFIQNWVNDRRKVIVEAPNGAKIEFTSERKYSEKEIFELVNKLNKITKDGVKK